MKIFPCSVFLIIFLVGQWHSRADVPLIKSISLSEKTLNDGGSIKITLRVQSDSPILFIEKNLTGPNGNIYSGGSEAIFSLSNEGDWLYEWVDEFSPFVVSGVYAFTRIRVRDSNDQWSDFWPVETFFLNNSVEAKKPIIESVEINPSLVKNGGEITVRIRVRSNVEVDFLQKDLSSPLTSLYRSGEAVSFNEEEPGVWQYQWTDNISFFMPSGKYKYENIRVSNIAKLDSDYWPEITFDVDNSIIQSPDDSFVGSYAKWVLVNNNEGYGLFPPEYELPFFSFKVTGEYVPGQTSIVVSDIFNFRNFEDVLGEADNADNLRIQTAGVVSEIKGVPTSRVEITFSSPLDPKSIAFAVTDLDIDDAVISASYKGVKIKENVISRWLKDLFDSKPSSNVSTPDIPFWDPVNSAIVSFADADGILSDDRISLTGESASAWFIPDVLIDSLVIEQRNRWASGSNSSIHIYIGALNRIESQLLIERKNDIELSFKGAKNVNYIIQSSSDLKAWDTLESGINSKDLGYIISENHKKKVYVPQSEIGNDWTSLIYDDSSWVEFDGVGIGYDTASSFDSYFSYDLKDQMRGIQTSAYLRIPFMVEGLEDIQDLILGVRVDDGFVAYLNGHKVTEYNAPTLLEWNSKSSRSNSDIDALRVSEFLLDEHIDKLILGENILAIHALNYSINNSDFLFSCQLGGTPKRAKIFRNYPISEKNRFFRVVRE